MTRGKIERDTIALGWRPADGDQKGIAPDLYVEVSEPQASNDWAGRFRNVPREYLAALTSISPQPYQSAMQGRFDTFDSEAIFESAGQAVHVAYTIMSQPAQQDSMLRKALVGMLAAMPELSPRLTAWFEQLRGTPSDTVHFGGLSSYDVRAQCALILLAVRTKLPEPEMWALQAKYAKTDEEAIDKKVRYAFSAEKAAAIRALSQWLVQTSAFESMPISAMDCMVAKFYTHQRKTEISFRDLAKTFGGNHMTYARAFPKVKKLLRPLESMALTRLQPYFAEQGVVFDQLADQVRLG
jgi:hypothetical protein